MGINKSKIENIKKYVIKPTLEVIDLYSDDVAELVLHTGLIESNYEHIKQINGIALSFWQIEPATHDDIHNNFLKYRKPLLDRLKILSDNFESKELEKNYWYAAAICRIHYLRVPERLPLAGDIEGQARYWKQYYNTALGKGDVDKFIFRIKEYYE